MIVVLGTLAGSLFSLGTAFLYVASIRSIGPSFFRTWRLLLWFPVHVVFAVSQAAPMLIPIQWLRWAGTAFPLDTALFALTLVFGILGFIPPITYFFRKWRQLRELGYWRTAKV